MLPSGHAVISSPVSTCERPYPSSNRNGRAMLDSICAVKAVTELHMDSANTRMRSRSTGNSGTLWCSWRRTYTTPIAAPASSMPIALATAPGTPARVPKVSTPRKIRPNIAALSSTSSAESLPSAASPGGLAGSARRPSSSSAPATGRLIANSQGQLATDSTAAATLGPATEATATVIELTAIPRPSKARG